MQQAAFRRYVRGMNRIFPLTLILVATLTTAAPAGAATPKFKADVYIHQSAEWANSWTMPIIRRRVPPRLPGRRRGLGDLPGQGRPRHVQAWARRLLADQRVRFVGQARRSAGFDVGESGNPEGCLPDWVHLPQPVDTSSCGFKTVTKSSRSFWLTIAKGRIAPAGAFTGKDGGDPYDNACPDPSLKSAIVESVHS